MSKDLPLLEHAMLVIMLANPADKESIKRAQDKVLDALVERAAVQASERQRPDYDGREP